MRTFSASQSQIHVIARAILLQGDQLVLCRVRGHDRFFLPGGPIENGELAEEALTRELKEELGITEYKKIIFAGVCEGTFTRDHVADRFEHQINLVFEVQIPERGITSEEDHIEFACIDRHRLGAFEVMPKPIREGIFEWFNDGRPFFKSFRD